MKQAVLLVVVFLSFCVSSSLCYRVEDSYKKNCPNAKYKIADENALFLCLVPRSDPCEFDVHNGYFGVHIFEPVPEDVQTVYYEVLLSGDGINATASGEADVDKFDDSVDVYAEMKGDLPVGHKGTATVSLYHNEEKKDIPDWCVRTNIIIVSEDEQD